MRKHWAKSWFPDMKIGKKLMLISVAVLLPTLFFLLVVYHYWSSFIRQEAMNNFNTTHRELVQNIEDHIEQRQIIVRTLCESSLMQEMVSSKDPEMTERLYQASVKPVLDTLTETAQHGQMIWIIRYDSEGYEEIHSDYEGVLSGVRYNSKEIENGLKDYALLHLSRVSNQYWFRQLKGNLEEYKVQQTNMDYMNRCFSVAAEIRDDGTPVGMLRLISPLADLIGEEPRSFPAEGSISFVLDEEFYLLSSQQWKKQFMADNRALFQDAITQMEQGERYQEMNSQWIISADALGNTGFYLVVLNSSEMISEQTIQLRFILLASILVIFALVSIFILGTSRYLSNRLLHLLRAMQRFQKGEPNTGVTVRSKDEIGMLYAGYNQMTEQISKLMQRNIEIATEKEKAELHLLQMQINPHFLYNSLSTVFRLAELGENEVIQNMVIALTNFYRLSLNKGKHTYTVRDEMQQIEAYVQIFTIRKGDTFTCDIDFDPASSGYVMLKLVLQPFVENIFQHAFSEEHMFVHVVISQCCQEHMLVFRVEDDGCGMDGELLKELRNGSCRRDSNGFGVYNVESRLRLLYDTEYTLTIDSEKGKGTRITIRLPQREEGQI